jgi:hypothetical protein
MLHFRRVNLSAIRWDDEIQKYQDRTLFQTITWLSFIGETQNAEPVLAALMEGKETVGYFTGLIIKKWGLRILGSPFPGWTTSYMGFCLSSGISRREAIQALIPFVFDDLRCIHLEVLDRGVDFAELHGIGLAYRRYTGFQIDLTSSEQVLFSKMASSCRQCIRKSEKCGVIVEEVHDVSFAEEYCCQLADVFAKQSLIPTYGVDRVRKLIEHVGPTGMLLLLRARDREGHCIATGIFPAMNRTMYFWGGASWRRYQSLRPNEAIQWYAMKYWKQRGIRTYDMFGSGDYKKKYGGCEIAVPWFRKSKYPFISPFRHLAKQVVDWRQRIVGRAQCFHTR